MHWKLFWIQSSTKRKHVNVEIIPRRALSPQRFWSGWVFSEGRSWSGWRERPETLQSTSPPTAGRYTATEWWWTCSYATSSPVCDMNEALNYSETETARLLVLLCNNCRYVTTCFRSARITDCTSAGMNSRKFVQNLMCRCERSCVLPWMQKTLRQLNLHAHN